ncbi:transposase family protein [Streptomyces sp. NPDC006270]|uniref:helix-turn-helix domain-containing protein n=1 Tax=Streptomyces sp. NPDC006270 TaxID=3364741 RepID=UPI0036BD4D85
MAHPLCDLRQQAAACREQALSASRTLGLYWARLAARQRKRAVGTGATHCMVFVDRILATLVHLRHGVTHDVLACWPGVDRSSVTRAIGEVRPLLAERGCTVSPVVWLRTLAEVIDHLGQAGETGIIDCTEIRVHRPPSAARTRTSSKPELDSAFRQVGSHSSRGPRHLPHATSMGELT